jgi:hypothetical protein
MHLNFIYFRSAAPKLHALAETYVYCVEQPVSCLFFALAAALNYLIFGGDAQDAFAHSPAPKVPTFVQLDDAFMEWYKAQINITLDRRQVLPVLHALQGHPEAARLWEEHISKILCDLDFHSTTHEQNIYLATIDGHKILLLCQVDDFVLAMPDPAIAARLYDQIGKCLQLPGKTSVPFQQQGLIDSFNGVNILQTRHYIKLSCTSYIRRLLAAHHWATPALDEPKPGSRPTEPLPASAIHALYQATGFLEGSPEHAALAKDMGFSYRTLLGKILYAYVTARPNIGYAISTLAKFATTPAKLHCTCLKGLALYLHKTIDWGIVYWRPKPQPALPDIPLADLSPDPSLPLVPHASNHFQLFGYVNASHANDLRKRRSTTGYAFLLSGGVVAYRSKTQSLTATSSTEAEFIAAIS